MSTYPETDVVILAGGQARRMQGRNKLLQQFDQEIQLIKIYKAFCGQVSQIWINSHRDLERYQEILPEIRCFSDDQSNFLGPLMGIKSAWSHVKTDYILFIPCDITFIPEDVLSSLHQALLVQDMSQVVYVTINEQNLYPFCLIKKQALKTINKHLEQDQLSLRKCFDELFAQTIHYESHTSFHSINSEQELKQYHQELQNSNRSKS